MDWILRQARAIGFDLCGVAPAAALADSERREEWLARGYAGDMQYLHDARRSDPARAMPEAKSAVVCAVNYNTAQPLSTEAAAEASAGPAARGWISRYAWGDDYHEVAGAMLEQLAVAIRQRFGPECLCRAYVDTGPISERRAAWLAGLGWIAKNTCLINGETGSWLFLGVILTSLELAPTGAAAEMAPADQCGQCTLCLEACPTGALVEPGVLDARLCISYLTIELRGAIPEKLRPAMGRHVFGCDICQDVCPWNRHAPATPHPAFAPREKLLAPELDWLLGLDENEFRRVFRKSAVRRTKWRGLVRNACVAAGNARVAPESADGARLRGRLETLAASDDAVIAEHARWALRRIGRAPESAEA